MEAKDQIEKFLNFLNVSKEDREKLMSKFNLDPDLIDLKDMVKVNDADRFLFYFPIENVEVHINLGADNSLSK